VGIQPNRNYSNINLKTINNMKHLTLIFILFTSAIMAQDRPDLAGTQTPVEFTGLSTFFNKNLSLMWSTASEANNSHFLILRSLDKGITWAEVGTVQGNGTTKVKHQYIWSELDQISGPTYYRLIQVDLDGKETELTIIFYDFINSVYNGFMLNGKILSIRKVQEQGSNNLMLVITDRQVYKILTKYNEE